MTAEQRMAEVRSLVRGLLRDPLHPPALSVELRAFLSRRVSTVDDLLKIALASCRQDTTLFARLREVLRLHPAAVHLGLASKLRYIRGDAA